jgi:hypothetical protein
MRVLGIIIVIIGLLTLNPLIVVLGFAVELASC